MENLIEQQRVYVKALNTLERTSEGYGGEFRGADQLDDEGKLKFEIRFPGVLDAASWARMVKDNWGVEVDFRAAVNSMWETVTLTCTLSYAAADKIVNKYKTGRMEVPGAELRKGDVLLSLRGADVRYLLIDDVKLREPHSFGIDRISYLIEFDDTPAGREAALNDLDSQRRAYHWGIDTRTDEKWPIERY